MTDTLRAVASSSFVMRRVDMCFRCSRTSAGWRMAWAHATEKLDEVTCDICGTNEAGRFIMSWEIESRVQSHNDQMRDASTKL